MTWCLQGMDCVYIQHSHSQISTGNKDCYATLHRWVMQVVIHYCCLANIVKTFFHTPHNLLSPHNHLTYLHLYSLEITFVIQTGL